MTNGLADEKLQKTWIPEGTQEYKTFKHVTQENAFLSSLLKERFPLMPDDLVLDVGGREGDIARSLQQPQSIHLVDPDPTLKLPFTPGKFWNTKIQDTDLGANRYALIICSHVLGYLSTHDIQEEVITKLLGYLKLGGTLVLFYNTNSGYMGELLAFAKQNLTEGHYDYFNEELLSTLDAQTYEISHQDVTFSLDYPSYEDLAHCCWFLFGAKDQDIEGVASKFLPKLKEDLERSSFPIEERVMFIKKIS